MLHYDDNNQFKIKIAIIGDPGGKTAFLAYYLDNKFSLESSNLKSTVGGDFKLKTLTMSVRDIDTTIKLHIWDISGQPRFQPQIPIYLENSEIVFIGCDLTNRQTFDNLKTYFELVEGKVLPANIVFVGMKADLENEGVVPVTELQQFAEARGCEYVMTSAKTGQGINDLFQKAVEKVLVNVFSVNSDDSSTKPIQDPQTQQQITALVKSIEEIKHLELDETENKRILAENDPIYAGYQAAFAEALARVKAIKDEVTIATREELSQIEISLRKLNTVWKNYQGIQQQIAEYQELVNNYEPFMADRSFCLQQIQNKRVYIDAQLKELNNHINDLQFSLLSKGEKFVVCIKAFIKSVLGVLTLGAFGVFPGSMAELPISYPTEDLSERSKRAERAVASPETVHRAWRKFGLITKSVPTQLKTNLNKLEGDNSTLDQHLGIGHRLKRNM